MKTLVAFSGGLDSSYVLWRLLSTTNDEITAVFFDFSYVTGGNCQSALSPWQIYASTNIVEYLKQTVRDFNVITHSPTVLLDDEETSVHTARWAAAKIAAGEYDRFVTGHEATVESREEFYAKNNLPPRSRLSPGQAAKKAFAQITDASKIWYPLSKTEWRKRTSEQIAELPAPVVAMALSCQNPIRFNEANEIVPCGVCFKCKRNNILKERLNAGDMPDQAWNVFTSSETYEKYVFSRNQVKSVFEKYPLWNE